jgi:hypothetical protein
VFARPKTEDSERTGRPPPQHQEDRMIEDPWQRSSGIGRRNDPGCWRDLSGRQCGRTPVCEVGVCRLHLLELRRWSR